MLPWAYEQGVETVGCRLFVYVRMTSNEFMCVVVTDEIRPFSVYHTSSLFELLEMESRARHPARTSASLLDLYIVRGSGRGKSDICACSVDAVLGRVRSSAIRGCSFPRTFWTGEVLGETTEGRFFLNGCVWTSCSSSIEEEDETETERSIFISLIKLWTVVLFVFEAPTVDERRLRRKMSSMTTTPSLQ